MPRNLLRPEYKPLGRVIPGTSNPCKWVGECTICPKIDKSGKITSYSTKTQYKTKIHVSCQSSNLIYVMSCKVCGLQSVGQTKRTIAERFKEHFRSINKANSTDLKHVHFNSRGHHGTDDIQISIISHIKEHPDSARGQQARDKMEMFWYHQLGTVVPRGLNVEKNAQIILLICPSTLPSVNTHRNPSRTSKLNTRLLNTSLLSLMVFRFIAPGPCRNYIFWLLWKCLNWTFSGFSYYAVSGHKLTRVPRHSQQTLFFWMLIALQPPPPQKIIDYLPDYKPPDESHLRRKLLAGKVPPLGEPLLIMVITHFGNLMIRILFTGLFFSNLTVGQRIPFFLVNPQTFFTGSPLLLRGSNFNNHMTYYSLVIGPAPLSVLVTCLFTCCQAYPSWDQQLVESSQSVISTIMSRICVTGQIEGL